MEPKKGNGLSASRGPGLKLSWIQFCVPENRGSKQLGHGKTWSPPPSSQTYGSLMRTHRPSLTRPHGAFCNVTAKVPEERLLARMY